MPDTAATAATSSAAAATASASTTSPATASTTSPAASAATTSPAGTAATSTAASSSATAASTTAAVHAAEVRRAERGRSEAGEGEDEAQSPALPRRQDHPQALGGREEGPRARSVAEGEWQEAGERLQRQADCRQRGLELLAVRTTARPTPHIRIVQPKRSRDVVLQGTQALDQAVAVAVARRFEADDRFL